MKFKLQLVIEEDREHTYTEDIIEFNKANQPSYCLGLSLIDSKKVLKIIQEKMIHSQVQAHLNKQKCCPNCHHKRRLKSYETFQYRTLFGTVVLPNIRLYHCQCQSNNQTTFSVLNEWIATHTSPELQYIETKWGSHISFKKTVELLKDVLPVSKTLSGVTARNHLHKIAKMQESELEDVPRCLSGCKNEWAKLPKPDKPLVVGADGGYVRSFHDKKKNFEVIVGKVYSKTKSSKRFGMVQKLDPAPQRRLMNVLLKQGMQANQQITFLSDGADNVRDLQFIMHPEAEYVLDWFHVTMRITVLKQFAKGVIKVNHESGQALMEHLESSKWNLWHGKTLRALEHLEDCYVICDDEMFFYKNKKKLLAHLDDFITYIENNAHVIPNYGDRWRYGEAISTSFVESTVNEVITKRMVKKQQMQWTAQGAHYMIQARTTTLNGDLAKHFERWYPGLTIEESSVNLHPIIDQAHICPG